jgi:hypothetical protein
VRGAREYQAVGLGDARSAWLPVEVLELHPALSK